MGSQDLDFKQYTQDVLFWEVAVETLYNRQLIPRRGTPKLETTAIPSCGMM